MSGSDYSTLTHIHIRRTLNFYAHHLKYIEALQGLLRTVLSESTVGRIFIHLKQRRLITKSSSALRTKRKRVFNKHAKAWTFKKYEEMTIGERVQIDHMTVSKNGCSCKHFQAWESLSGYIDARVYSNSNASSAKRFLLEFVKNALFPIFSIQVDGGSEFMAEF